MTVIPASEFGWNSKKYTLKDLLDTVDAMFAANTPTDPAQVATSLEISSSTKPLSIGKLIHTSLAAKRGTLALSGTYSPPDDLLSAPVKRFHLSSAARRASGGGGGTPTPAPAPFEKAFTYAEGQMGWTLTRSEKDPTLTQLYNSKDPESASHYMAIIEGTHAAAQLTDLFLTSASDRAATLFYEVSVDGGAYTRTPYNASKDDYQLFSGLADGPHLVAMRSTKERLMYVNLKKANNMFRVTGSAPKIKNVDQWLMADVTTSNFNFSQSLFAGQPNIGNPANEFKPSKYGHYIPGGQSSVMFRANVTELWVVTSERMIHLFDGTNMTVYDTGSDVLTNDADRVRTYRITGLSGLKTYNLWTSFRGNINFLSVGLVGGTAQTLPARKLLDQYGDSITRGTLPAAQYPGSQDTSGTGYTEVYRVAARLGRVGQALGVGGYTVGQLNNDIDGWMAPRTITSDDAAILAIGQNAGIPDISVYNSIVDKMLAKGYGRVICRGIIPVVSGDSASISAQISAAVTARNDPRVKYLNVDNWVVHKPNGDGIHPDIQGYVDLDTQESAALPPLLA